MQRDSPIERVYNCSTMRKPNRGQLLLLIFLAALVVVFVVIRIANAGGTHNAVVPTSNATTTVAHATTTTAGVNYILASQASNYLNQVETVRVHIAYTYTDSAGTEFLDQYVNYASGFVVCIFSSDLFNFAADPASTYGGSTIDVTGLVTTYNGYVEILNPTNITTVS